MQAAAAKMQIAAAKMQEAAVHARQESNIHYDIRTQNLERANQELAIMDVGVRQLFEIIQNAGFSVDAGEVASSEYDVDEDEEEPTLYGVHRNALGSYQE